MQDAPQPVEGKETPKGVQAAGDRCRFCLSRDFKRSRLHADDVFTLLKMRMPARCVRCGQMQTISFRAAMRALPAGGENEPSRPLPSAMTPAALRDPGPGVRAAEPQVASRSALPKEVLRDALDIRCQYCPGQMFRRSRLRLLDVWLIARMQYSVRCLLCGQRQTVNFMVAGSAVGSHVKQGRSISHGETWKEFTSVSAPVLAAGQRQAPLAPVVEHVYALKEMAPGEVGPDGVKGRGAAKRAPGDPVA